MVLIAAALALLASGACNRRHKRTIGVVPKATSHMFWLSVEAGALAAGRQFNVNVEWNGPAQETEYDRQIQIVDSMIARRVDGLAVAAAERHALSGPIERAAALGIPVTVFDSGVDTDKYMTYIATDNYDAGEKSARELARLLGGNGRVAVIMHAPGSASTMDRERGFADAIAKEFPRIHIVARQYGMSDRSRAMAATEDILTANPRLNGLFASSEPSAVGAALALKSRGLSGAVRLVAVDSSEEMVAFLREGAISALVVQDPFKMGFQTVQSLVDKLNGHTPPKRIDLTARLIVKKDLDDPAVRKLLDPGIGASR